METTKEWRPEGWEEIRKRVVYGDMENGYTWSTGFEAGADAMLKALREAGMYGDGDNPDWIEPLCLCIMPGMKGYLVFIPENTESRVDEARPSV